MKAVWKRSLSLFLIFAMALTVCLTTGSETWATEVQTDPAEEETVSSDPGESGVEEDVEISAAVQESTDVTAEGSIQDDVEGAQTTDDLVPNTAGSEEEIMTLNEAGDPEDEAVVISDESFEVTLLYDDYAVLSDCIDGMDLSEYEGPQVEDQEIGSYQVSKGTKSDDLDDNVLEIDEDTGQLHASGIGTATLVWEKEEDNTITDTVTLEVTVEAAPLTVMFVAGQSNAEGNVSAGSYADSILCEEGQVYSTYAPSSATNAQNNTGLNLSGATVSTAASFVAGSLTGTADMNGNALTYPLTALTSGQGKTGMDSGLAYQWHKDTGDKVWVVNAACSNTSIATWVPGGTHYERALAVYQYALQTVSAEVSAGHYTLNNTLLFWLQGEYDTSMSAADYIADYTAMYQGFASEDLGIEKYGIIEVRAANGNNTTSADLYMTGPRIAQYLMGNSTDYPNIYVVSNANEQWVSDSGVKSYFQNQYGSALSYPTHSGTSALPTTVSDVHSDVHYSQIAHNENGITAAEGMYQIMYGNASASSVSWYEEGGTALDDGAQLSLGIGGTATCVPVADPVYASKGMTVSSRTSTFTYDETTGTLTIDSEGSGTLTASVSGASASLAISGTEMLDAPVLKAATAASDGTIQVTWNSVSGATGYRVFRKESGGSWGNIALTTSTSYTDETAVAGTTYIYTIRAYRGTQTAALANCYSETYWSGYDSTGVSAQASAALVTPVLKSASASSGSIQVTWNSVSGASGYRVFRKTSGGSWSNIDLTTSTSYTDSDVEVGTTYIYTVRAYKGDQSTAVKNAYYASCWSGYDSTGVSAKATSALSTPVLKSASATNGSIQVTWNSVSGASGYRVFRKKSGGSWGNIGVTTSTSYTDSDVDVGTTYIYTVRAYKGDQSTALKNTYKGTYWSDYDSTGVSAKAAYALSMPVLKSATATNGTIQVTWNSVSGASGYRVFRKVSGGSWGNIGLTTSTSYTDSDVEVGATYIYTVRAYKGDQSTAVKNAYKGLYWSDYDSAGVSAKANSALSTPVLQSATATNGTIQVTWNSVSGASGYRVFRKKSGGSWSNIGVTTSTSYTDSTVEVGTTYIYTVRAYKGDQSTALKNTYKGPYWSAYDSTGVSAKATSALATPVLKSATATNGTIQVTWNSVSGAGGYRVFRKTSGGSWSNIGVTTSTSYTDSEADAGTTYYYTVRAYKGDQSTALKNTYYASYWSDYDSAGVSAKGTSVLATPVLKSATATNGTVKVTWNSVSGASGYRVFRKTSGGSWSNIDLTTSTSYTDSNVEVGTTYYYTVRAYKDDQSTALKHTYKGLYWSDYDTSGVSVKATSVLATPSLTSASASSGKITVKWNSVSGATGYAVYRKVSGGSWSMIGTTTSTSYTDSYEFAVGTAYYYTVRAFKGTESTAKAHKYNAGYWSDYVSAGVSAKAVSVLSTPTLKSASKGSSGVVITWNSVSNATGYRVFRKVAGGSWSNIGLTTSTSYTDTSSLSSAATYYYTVRAYKGDQSTALKHTYTVNYWSDYSSSGVSYTVPDSAKLAMETKAQSYSSSTKWLLLTNSSTNKTGVFYGSKGNWELKYYWDCTTGKSSTPTRKGTYSIKSKGKSFSGSTYTCWYYSQWYGDYLYHSVLYKKGSMSVISDGRLGQNLSHGCVRLAIDNAKWIYDNIPKGTTVVSY